jgi:site-specific DNA-methyltransferase (adenine-specific)
MDTIEGVPAVNMIYNVDIFALCAAMPPGSVDMILCDLPYAATQNEWDVLIPFEPMWTAYQRVIKSRGAIVLTANQPFSSQLVCSNLKMFRYEWIWRKSLATGFLDANRKPMKQHESILVFCDSRAPYYPQMSGGEPYKGSLNNSSSNYGKFKRTATINESGDRYPKSVIEFNNEQSPQHPTQKPVDLFRYLIRTYTLPGELVFDPTCGSGTTAVAARAEGRNFIVGDSSPEYVAIAQERLRLPFEPHVVTKADKPIPRPTVQVGDITLEQQVMFE